MRTPLFVPLAGLLALTGLRAQNDFCLLKTSPGTIGQTLSFSYSGATVGTQILFMPSTNAGPIPVALLCPGDLRTIDVGIDLSALWSAQVVTTGSGAFGLPIPLLTGLHGLLLHNQAVTLPGATCLVGQISNKSIAQLGLQGAWTSIPATLIDERALGYSAAAGAVQCGNGDVILMSGGSGSLTNIKGLTTTDVYNWHTMTVSAGPTIAVGAIGSATTLPDGRVLLVGGIDLQGNAVTTCQLYNPTTKTLTNTGSLNTPRAGHAAALLPNGDVLVSGGTTILSDILQALTNVQNTCERWSAATGTWSSAPNMPDRLILHCMTSLNNGQVLLSGGYKVNVILGIPFPVGTVADCRLFNTNNTWSTTASLNDHRALHVYNTVKLANGGVLVSGGAQGGAILTLATPIDGAEVYLNGAWTRTSNNMSAPRVAHATTVMSDGSVIVTGGATGTVAAPVGINVVDRYSPSTNSWTRLADLLSPRAGHHVAVLPDGTLLVLGGQLDTATTLNTIEAYRP